MRLLIRLIFILFDSRLYYPSHALAIVSCVAGGSSSGRKGGGKECAERSRRRRGSGNGTVTRRVLVAGAAVKEEVGMARRVLVAEAVHGGRGRGGRARSDGRHQGEGNAGRGGGGRSSHGDTCVRSRGGKSQIWQYDGRPKVWSWSRCRLGTWTWRQPEER